MIIGVGIDLVQNSRIEKSLETHKLSFLKKILTKVEIDRIKKEAISIPHLSGVFAAKEAIIKSLTTYLGFSLNFQEVIITNDSNGVPKITIISKTAKEKLSKVRLFLSISHEKSCSVALCLAELNTINGPSQ